MSALHPVLYQVNTRVWLNERRRSPRRQTTLDDFDEAFLEEASHRGFDWLWPLGVWQTGPAACAISRANAGWRREYLELLPDLTEDDVVGSPFAIQGYTVHRDFGGDVALARLRQRLARREMHLLLDFVPNHMAPDHPWVHDHPEWFISGTADDLAREPQNYFRAETVAGPRVLAHGRDPNYDGWPDTAQLNYRSAGLRAAMIGELLRIAGQCDGVRCDMAMLLLPSVIARTWGDRSRPSDGSPAVDVSFWLEAIGTVHREYPDFIFMAEVYWDLEWELQQQGFDYTYDKRLYDRLHAGDAEPVREHLWADDDFQRRSVRFLENHDEPRAAAAFSPAMLPAAAVIALMTPGLRLLHEGQLEGRRQRVSVHLGRRPLEPVNNSLLAFYEKLLGCLRLDALRDGQWKLLESHEAWTGNPTHRQFIPFFWQGVEGERVLIVVNYGPTQGQCHVPLAWPDLSGRNIQLTDRMSSAHYERRGNDLAGRGLYIDLPAWGFNVFEVTFLK